MPVNPWQHPYAALGATEFRDLKMTCLKITAAQLKVLVIGGGVKQETTVSIVYPKLHTLFLSDSSKGKQKCQGVHANKR